MAQNMAVSVTLRLQDQFTGPVRALMQQMQQLTQRAQEFNRALGGTGSTNTFARLQREVRGVANEVRQLASSFSQLGRAMGTPSRGGLVQGQVASMRQLLGLQQQALRNQAQLNAGGGSGRVPNVPGAGGIWGRRGFSPNASLADRAQYRLVNVGEQSLVSGFLDLDRARTRLQMLATPNDGQRPILTPEDVAAAEQAATQFSQIFRSLSRAHVLDTFGEVATQFQNVDHAFRLLPELLNVQDWHVLMGDSVDQARAGMLSLVRAIGLSGRLVDNEGRLSLLDPNNPDSPIQASAFLDAYMRARIVGGRDVTPDQVFQVMKYLKASGQSLDLDSLLTTFVAMPDIRGSTFGNQLNMLIRTITGGGTQASLQALERAGLGRITDRTASGPHGFQLVDEEMLRENPFAWFAKNVMGPQGFLRRAGLDPRTAGMAQVQTAMRQAFGSNQSAFNIATMMVGQWREWADQTGIARLANLTGEARRQHAGESSWHQLNSARSALQDAMGSVAENFKTLLNPALESATAALKKLSSWVDPKTGNPVLSTGVLAGGSIAAFMMGRNILRMMGPWQRMLIGGGLGYLLGGPTEALMGAMVGRGMGAAGGSAAGAAGVAGAAAGAAFGGRFMTAVRFIARGVGSLLKGSLIWGAVGFGITQIIDNWEAVKTRLLAIWEDLRQAAPAWAGGEAKGWQAFAQGPAMNQTGNELNAYLQSNERGLQDWLRGTGFGQWLISKGLAMSDDQLNYRRLVQDYKGMGIDLPALDADARARAVVPDGGRPTVVSMGPVTINNTINVATNADPKAIGDAAGSAVQSQLRGILADMPATP
jgi:hypothetical protein